MARRLVIFTCLLIALALGTAGCGGGSSNSGPDPLMSGLIHWWRMDGNATDSAGTLNGAIQGPVTFSTGVYGQAAGGNGSTTGIAVPDSTDMQLQGSFTLSVWVNITAYPASSQLTEAIFFRGDDRSGLDPILLCVNHSNQVIFEVDGNSASDVLTGPAPLGKFINVTGVNDPGTGKMILYENGVVVAGNSSAVVPIQNLDATAKPGIGILCNNDFPNSAYNFSFNGIVDDVRVYNRALSASEVVTLYNRGVASAQGTGVPL